MLKLLAVLSYSILGITILLVGYLLFTTKVSADSQTLQLLLYSPLPKNKTTPVPTHGIKITPSPTTTVLGTTKKTTVKKNYTIAIFGDSMIDTMGEKLEYVDKALSASYPQTKFSLYNYGVGAQNISDGLDRFSNALNFKTRHFPSIPDLHPDVIILGSFAYNPFNPHDRNKHYLALAELVKKARSVTPSVYLLQEIAPKKSGFGKGPHGVNWTDDAAYTHVLHIVEQLQDVNSVSTALGTPVISAYRASSSDGTFGLSKFVNPDDGIHPSVTGNILTAQIIVKTLILK